MFGSCWGLQLAAVAAGGDVASNPARPGGRLRPQDHSKRLRPQSIRCTPAATVAFDAPAIHADEVVRLPPDSTVTAEQRA